MSEKNKLPIFIGCSNPEVVKLFDEIISQNTLNLGDDVKSSELFELAVINPEIQQKLEQQYVYMQMDKEQRSQVLKAQANEQERAKARQTAITIQEVLTKAHFGKDSEFNVDNFNKTELKQAIMTVKKQSLSNKDVDGLVEFISLHNFISPVDLEVKPHLRRWMFTLSDADLATATSELQNEVLAKIEELQGQYDMLDRNRKHYEQQAEQTKLAEDAVKTIPETPAKKTRKPRAKKKVDCCVDGECTCGSKEVTETEQLLKEEENHNSNDTNDNNRD